MCTVESLQNAVEHAGEGRSFCVRPPGGVALPYASSTIVGPAAAARGSGDTATPGGCIPNPQAYMIQTQPPKTASSCDKFAGGDATSLQAAERRNDSTGLQGIYHHF